MRCESSENETSVEKRVNELSVKLVDEVEWAL
jgi:hypothetical protein